VLLLASLVVCAIAGLALAISASPTSAEQRMAPSGTTPTPTPCSTSYSCAVTPGATIVPGTTDTGNHCDDCVTNITLPFSFSLYGASYTSVNVSSNGNAQFVSTNIEFSNVCL